MTRGMQMSGHKKTSRDQRAFLVALATLNLTGDNPALAEQYASHLKKFGIQTATKYRQILLSNPDFARFFHPDEI